MFLNEDTNRTYAYIRNTQVNQTFCNILIKSDTIRQSGWSSEVLKVTKYTWLWGADLTLYSPSDTQ